MEWKNFLLPGRIRKKDGYYHMIIDTKHPETNDPIRHSASTKLKVEEQTKSKSKENFITANNMLAEFRKKWTNHYFSKEKKILLFTDYMRDWLDDVKPNLEYSTYSNYKLIIENKIIPYFEPKKIMLDELTAKEIQEFYSYSLNVCEVSPNTVLRYHANIRKALQTALKHGLVSNNQADLVERPKKKQYVASIVNKNEIFYLLEKIKDTYLEMPVYLAGFYGLRRSEAIGLLWSSVDFENNTFEINNTVTPIKENGIKSYVNRRRTKTKKSRRTLVLIPQLKEILLKKRQQIEYYREMFGNTYNKKYLDNVCVKEDGNIINPDYVTKKFTEIALELGFSDIHFHSLRHSFATFIYQEGVDMKTIQHWLGHSTISTTMDIYTHLPLQNMENTAKIIETLVKEKNKQ